LNQGTERSLAINGFECQAINGEARAMQQQKERETAEMIGQMASSGITAGHLTI
jgi:hypothetical protein